RQQTPDADGKNPPNIQHTVEFSKDNHTTVQADPQGQTFRKATSHRTASPGPGSTSLSWRPGEHYTRP
ncbi:hypothetical protein, partial [Actinomycetospora callitridis]|uniref:hypothetical protein n=1 Tax=Actinomycetospora callitridis TaxID=913944 RepID=UPI0023652047